MEEDQPWQATNGKPMCQVSTPKTTFDRLESFFGGGFGGRIVFFTTNKGQISGKPF